jgi:hypothetical protein
MLRDINNNIIIQKKNRFFHEISKNVKNVNLIKKQLEHERIAKIKEKIQLISQRKRQNPIQHIQIPIPIKHIVTKTNMMPIKQQNNRVFLQRPNIHLAVNRIKSKQKMQNIPNINHPPIINHPQIVTELHHQPTSYIFKTDVVLNEFKDIIVFLRNQYDFLIHNQNMRKIILVSKPPLTHRDASIYKTKNNHIIEATNKIYWGDEIHVTRHYLLTLLLQNLINADRDVIVIRNGISLYYDTIFKNIVQFDNYDNMARFLYNEERNTCIIHVDLAQNVHDVFVTPSLAKDALHFCIENKFYMPLDIMEPNLKKLMQTIRINNELVNNIYNEDYTTIKKYVVVIRYNELYPAFIDLVNYLMGTNTVFLYINDVNIAKNIFGIQKNIVYIDNVDYLYSVVNTQKIESIYGVISGFLETLRYIPNNNFTIRYFINIGYHKYIKNKYDKYFNQLYQNIPDYNDVHFMDTWVLKTTRFCDKYFYLDERKRIVYPIGEKNLSFLL